MRESTPRGPAIDLSEFERRLRGGQPAAKPKGDPLTELARLMQGDGESEAKAKTADLYDRLLTQEPPQARKSAPESSRPQAPRAASAPSGRPDPFGAGLRGSLAPEAPAAANEPRAYREPAYDDRAHQQAAHQDPSQARAGYGREPQPGAAGQTEQAYRANPAAQYADPGAYHADPRLADPNAHQADQRYADTRYADPHYAEGGWADESQNYLDYGPEGYEADYEQEPTPKGGLLSRLPKFRPWHAVAGISALAAVSIGWGFAHRSGGVGSHDIPTIGAPEGPAKIAPVAEEPQGSASQGAAVLERKEPAPVTQVVTHEEQAVDPQAAPRAVEIGAGPVNAPHEPPAPAPRKVKTISVRPDGSVIENDAVPPAVTSGVGLGAESLEAAQGGTPKSVARPTSTASAAKAAAPKAAAATAAAPKAAAPAKPKPPKVAAVEESPAADNPDDAAPAEEAPRGAGKGGYAVQFGAANSEAEARALLTQIAKKYAAQLGGRRPTFKPAKVDGKTVYRVRIGGVSKEAAAGICEKVKGGGGACFVAGN